MNWFNRPQCLPDHEWLRAFVPVLRRALLNPEPVVARILKIAEDMDRKQMTLKKARTNGGPMTPDKETLEKWAKRVASCRLLFGMSVWDWEARNDLAEAAEFLRTLANEPSQPTEAVWERAAAIGAALPSEALAGVPSDGATRHDQYLYGKTAPAESDADAKCLRELAVDLDGMLDPDPGDTLRSIADRIERLEAVHKSDQERMEKLVERNVQLDAENARLRGALENFIETVELVDPGVYGDAKDEARAALTPEQGNT